MKKITSDFKTFILRGNVIELAIGVVMGGAFGKIVSSLVNDIFMPLIGVLLGGLDFTALTLTVGSATIAYGKFLQNTVDFLVIATTIFVFVKVLGKLQGKKEQPKPEPKPEVKSAEVLLLEEIRDALKK